MKGPKKGRKGEKVLAFRIAFRLTDRAGRENQQRSTVTSSV